MPISICLKDAQFSLEKIHILNNQNAANRRHRSSIKVLKTPPILTVLLQGYITKSIG